MLEWEPSRFIGFYRVAKKKELEEKVYIQWVGMLPQLSKYTSFVEFYDMMTGASIDTRPKDEIINEIYELHGVKNDGK